MVHANYTSFACRNGKMRDQDPNVHEIRITPLYYVPTNGKAGLHARVNTLASSLGS